MGLIEMLEQIRGESATTKIETTPEQDLADSMLLDIMRNESQFEPLQPCSVTSTEKLILQGIL